MYPSMFAEQITKLTVDGWSLLTVAQDPDSTAKIYAVFTRVRA